MVKQVIFEDSHRKYLEKVAAQTKCTAGLILGHITSNKDYIASFIRCPSPTDGENVKQWNGVKDVEGSWVAGHSAQIISSLSGGINIVGVFLIAPTEEAKQVSEKLKQIVYQAYKLVSKTLSEVDNYLQDSDESLFWTVMHVDVKNGLVASCRQYDVKDNKDIGRPMDLKIVDAPIQWECCQTTLNINKVKSERVLTQCISADIFESMLKLFQDQVKNAIVTIEQKHRVETDVLNPSSTSNHSAKGSKKKKPVVKSQSAKTLSCQIFIPTSLQIENPDLCHSLQVCGSITAKAYLPPNSTVGQAVIALKRDILQTIHQRIEILSEDPIDLSGGEQKISVSFPRRVFASNGQNETILYSDYILHDEPLNDCLERFKDNLDMELQSNELSMENSFEKFQPEQDCSRGEAIESEMEGIHEGASKTNAVIALVATAVAFLGWIFSGLVINEN
ncbi:protein odr-4 homolog [Styela clava]